MHFGIEPGKRLAQIVGVVFLRPAFGGPLGAFFDSNHIEQGAVAQRIGHHMPPRPHMYTGMGWVAGGVGHDAAPCDLTGKERLLRCIEHRARRRMDTVCPDGQIGFAGIPGGQHDARSVAGDQRVDPLQKAHLHSGFPRCRREKTHQIGAVDEEVALILRQAGEVEPGHLGPGAAVAQRDCLPLHTSGRQIIAQTQRFDHAQTIGRDLNSRAHFGDLLGLFQNRDAGAALAQRHCTG